MNSDGLLVSLDGFLVNLAGLLVSLDTLLVNLAGLLVSLDTLLVNLAGLLVSLDTLLVNSAIFAIYAENKNLPIVYNRKIFALLLSLQIQTFDVN
ncbi:hypothetical protein QUF94_06655 [Peribacillus sp. NJ4]|uniref:hypothetical protein n=1 Tax=Peribacillus sp. NJ4 TaxID=3055862 RepID=UPI0025A29FEC|nr:hypothetical protein [Peribacillus sp. NJ4]MDM5211117.1 hypothetical protein [Peribacillus sp. NJ4]